jgi:hypothetical protein
LGVVYNRFPAKTARAVRFYVKDYVPTKTDLWRFKYGGILLILLGTYYILVIYDLLPALF